MNRLARFVDILPRRLPHGLLTRVVFWPVACSLVIMGGGNLFLWGQSRSTVIEDRKKVFEGLADFAERDLEDRLELLEQDLQLWSARWFYLNKTEPPDSHSIPVLEWGFSYRRDQHDLYELVLYIDRNGRTLFASSPHARREQLSDFVNQPVTKVLDLPANWLDQVLSKAVPLVEPPRQIRAVNRLRQRDTPPVTRTEVPSRYQLVLAVPARGDTSTDSVVDGAVVAVASWQMFQDELDKFKAYSSSIGLPSGYAFLINTDNDTVIGHEVRDPSGDNLYGTNLVKDHHLPDLANALRNNPHGTFPYDFRGAHKFAAVRRVNPPGIFERSLSWGLGVGVNEQEILDTVARLNSLYVGVGILASLAVLAAATVVGRHLSVSVNELTRVARDAGGATDGPGGSSDDEIVALQEAVNDLAVRLRKSNSFEPLINPYVVGTPIHQSTMFFGRGDDVTWMQGHLRQPGNELILLTGQRRIGKTSLLRHVKRLKDDLQLIPFFFDTQSLIPGITDDASFYQALLEEMLVQFCEVVPHLPEPRLNNDDSARESIWKILKYLNNECTGAVPVFLMDELENFEVKLRSGALTSDVLSFLAALLDSTRTVSFIATGSDRLERRRAKYWNTLLVKSVRRHLGVLSDRDALRIITEPLAGRVTYGPGIPAAILRLTGGHPYYTQDICQRLVNELNIRQTYQADSAALEEVLAQTLRNPPPTLDYFWTKGMRVQGRVFVSVLASALGDESRRLTVQEVIERASPTLRPQLVASKSRLSATVGELTSGDWLDDQNGFVRFKVDLLRRWLQREHPPSNVEIEIRYPAVLEAQYDA